MKKDQHKLGLVSVSFRDRTPKEIIEAVRAAGLSYIEWGSDIHAPCNDLERLEEIAHLQESHGIKCSSYGTYFRFSENSTDELEGYIRAAKILGTNILRLWCGKKRGSDMTDDERESLINDCRKAAKIAEKNGVILCMECHKKTFTEDTEDAAMLMREVASENFRMYWQPFQWQDKSENLINAERISPYTENIHVFNWKGDKKLPLIEAKDEWREYLKKFSKPHTLLLEFMPNGKIEELSNEADALRAIIGEKI